MSQCLKLISKIVVCGIFCLNGIDCFSDDAFHVFAPDPKKQQLMQLTVRTSADGVSIDQVEPLNLPFAPSSTALDAKRNQLIVTSGGKGNTQVATIQFTDEGRLRLLESSALKYPSGYTSVDRSGRYFMTIHYGSGTIAVYRIKRNGGVGDAVCSVKTPNAEAHCILTTRDNRFTYVPCVKNNNALFQFAFDEKTGQLSSLDPFDAKPPAMFGPRHVAYHPKLAIAYFSNEQQLGVSMYGIAADGQLSDKQHAVTLPRRSPYVQGQRGLHASDLVVSPDGKLLFVAIRDFVGDEDSVFTFRIEGDGKLSQIGRTTVGDIPWKLDLSPDGRFLLVSESADRRLSLYRIDLDGGLNRVAETNWNSGVRDMVVVNSVKDATQSQ